MTINIKEGLSFDDILIKPKYSEIKSRSNVDTSVHIGKYSFDHPIIVANMKTIAGKEMCQAVIRNGGLAILHRFMDEKEQLLIADDIIKGYGHYYFATSIGVKPSDREMVSRFWEIGVKIICIDIAHGDSLHCMEMCQWIRKKFPGMFIIAGNVATGVGAQRLWEAGANVVKVGIGSGGLCSTRIETGNGSPQITALMEVAETRRNLLSSGHINHAMYIISDGGVRSAGDVVKSMLFADMVMIGGLFAGCIESPGQRVSIDGINYKEYAGSSTHKTNHVEGVSTLVPIQGDYESILTKLLEGLRSGMSYQGACNLEELKEDIELIKISQAGLVESHPRYQHQIIK
jgi:IMP dehydrogenase